MKGRDVIALFEYGRAFDSKAKTKRRRKRKEPMMVDLDNLPVDVLMNKLDNYERKAKIISDYIEAKGRANKKEEKKEEKKGWEKLSFIQKITVLTAVVPVTIMIYMLVIIAFVKMAARLVGVQ